MQIEVYSDLKKYLYHKLKVKTLFSSIKREIEKNLLTKVLFTPVSLLHEVMTKMRQYCVLIILDLIGKGRNLELI